MLYLITYNESVLSNKKDIIHFIEEHLAYLIDDGFSFSEDFENIVPTIKIFKEGVGEFEWIKAKDIIIPFLQVFNDEFNIHSIKFTTSIYRTFDKVKGTIHFIELDNLVKNCYIPEYLTSIVIYLNIVK